MMNKGQLRYFFLSFCVVAFIDIGNIEWHGLALAVIEVVSYLQRVDSGSERKPSFSACVWNMRLSSAMNMPMRIFCAHAVIACVWRRGLVFCCFLLWYMCAEQGRERERACIDGMVSARIWHAGKAKLSRNISERCIILYHRGGTALLLIQSLWKIYIYNCIY